MNIFQDLIFMFQTQPYALHAWRIFTSESCQKKRILAWTFWGLEHPEEEKDDLSESREAIFVERWCHFLPQQWTYFVHVQFLDERLPVATLHSSWVVKFHEFWSLRSNFVVWGWESYTSGLERGWKAPFSQHRCDRTPKQDPLIFNEIFQSCPDFLSLLQFIHGTWSDLRWFSQPKKARAQ